eukprot:257560_1
MALKFIALGALCGMAVAETVPTVAGDRTRVPLPVNNRRPFGDRFGREHPMGEHPSPCGDDSLPVCADGRHPAFKGLSGPPACEDESTPLCADGSE